MSSGEARRFELLVFDWDGTLCDSVADIIDAMHGALAQLGLEPRSAEQIRGIIGLGLEEGLQRLYPALSSPDLRHLARGYRDRYRRLGPGAVRLYPGVRDTVMRLHGAGYSLSVASGKSRRGLDAAIEVSGLGAWVHATRSGDETMSKPHPRMLLELMELFDAAPSRTLMIGDSEHDLQMARNAGVAAAAVAYGAQDASRLLEFEPLTCFDTLADLPAWLEQHERGTPSPASKPGIS